MQLPFDCFSAASRLAAVCALACALGGCAHAKTAGKALATPLTVVRDAVDAPLVSLANVFETFADRTKPATAPRAGISAGLGGIGPYVSYDLSNYLFKALSWVFGGVDYVPCRSVWPNFPRGISPWKTADAPWGSLYFPNTRELWKAEGEEPKPAGVSTPPAGD